MKGDGLNNNSPNVESFIELCLYDCAHTSKNITQIQHEKLMKPLSFVENELAGQLPTRLAEEFADKLYIYKHDSYQLFYSFKSND